MQISNLPKAADAQKANIGLEMFKSAAELPQAIAASVFGNSPFLARIIESEPDFFLDICQNGFDYGFNNLLENIRATHPKELTKADLMSFLRICKRKISLLVAIADITKSWNLQQVTAALSDFADAALNLATECLLHEKYKNKQIDTDEPAESGLFILAVGKLGAKELNYSSDIDIMVFYDENRSKYSGKLSPREFFVRFTQELVEIMQQRTAEGYIFRTDLRIRPDPYSTPIAVSTAAGVQYYQSVGQNWERAALIKARFVAGDNIAATNFLNFIKTFIWRVNLDFNAIEDIKSVKRQIDSSHPQKPESLTGYNVKLGKGGIREIEFYAQTQQLIWGGREVELTTPATCDALKALEKYGKIKKGNAAKLIDAYEYLREVEHRLQMVADEHTHSLPNTQQELDKFAVFMGYNNPQDFYDALAAKSALVQSLYAELFEESASLSMGGNLVFTGVTNDPETLLTLSKLGFKQPEKVAEIIRGWHHGRRESTAFQRVREILTELVPHILRSFGSSNNPDEALVKFDDFLSQIPSAVTLFNLLNEKNELIDLMAEVMGNSPWLASNLSRSPELVQQILEADFYKDFPTATQLQAEFANITDIKQIRRLKHEKEFQIGIMLLKNIISHKQAAEHLSGIAVVVLSRIYDLTAENFDGEFAIIAMGKFGLGELTFNSDLDLVFVYDSAKPNASQHYEHFVKKFVQIISALSEDGILYNTDLRLRPMGEKGALACSLTTYEKYYSEAAWNWEFMALTKANPIIGSPKLCERLKTIISANINRKHDDELGKRMFKMRQKIAESHPCNNIWDVKYATGGIFEAEFIIQYHLLTGNKNIPLDLYDNLQFLKDVQSAIRLTTHGVFDEAAASPTHKATLANSLTAKNFDILKAKLQTTQNQVAAEFRKVFDS